MQTKAKLRKQFFALKDGKAVGIGEVANGISCGCICPHCSAALIARQGDVRVWHFAHHKGLDSKACAESALHLLAKSILQDHKELVVPLPQEKASLRIRAERVEVEAKKESLRPDVVFHVLEPKTGKLRPLFIEITVLHPVEEEKLAVLIANEQSTLEIKLDLSLGLQTREQVRVAVIEELSNKRWLFNTRIALEEDLPKQNRIDSYVFRPKPQLQTSSLRNSSQILDHGPNDFGRQDKKSSPPASVARGTVALSETQAIEAHRLKHSNRRRVTHTSINPSDRAQAFHWVEGCPLSRESRPDREGGITKSTCVETECQRCRSFDGFFNGVEYIICFGKRPIPDWYHFYRNL